MTEKPIIYYLRGIKLANPIGTKAYLWIAADKIIGTDKIIAFNPETNGIETKTMIFLPKKERTHGITDSVDRTASIPA